MMVDVHCHIIPSIDDGSKNMEMSVQMAKIAYKDGIRRIIATPHFHRNHFENVFNGVEEQVEKLNLALQKECIDIEILPGQEIFLDNHTLENYKAGIIKPLLGKKYMLFELDFGEIPKHALDIIYEFKVLGMEVIIAHPERYSYMNKNICEINKFIEEGCLFQINAGSINGIYGREAEKTAKRLIENGLCDFIGSDAHDAVIRQPKISECLKWIGKKNLRIYNDVIENAMNLVDGKDISVNHEKIRKRKWMLFGDKNAV